MASNNSTETPTSMGQEETIYSLPYMNPDNVTEATYNISFPSFYCSYVYLAYDNEEHYFILNPTSDLNTIRSLCSNGTITFRVMVWICFILGVPGNILAIITMATMPKSTGTFYIIVLAVWDLLAMIIRSIDSLLRFYDVIYFNSLCRFIYALTHFTTINANWILVLISIERFVTVRFPLKKRYYFTLKRARLSVLVLACLFTPFGIVDILAQESKHNECTISGHAKDLYENIWLHVVNAFYSFIPAVLILLFALLVVLAFRQHRSNLDTVMKVDNDHLRKRHLEAGKAETILTTMMFFTFAVFILVTTPVCIFLIIIMSNDEQPSPVSLAREKMLEFLISSLTLISHAINFFIYFLSARKFRSHLFGLFRGVFKIKRKSMDETRTSVVPDM